MKKKSIDAISGGSLKEKMAELGVVPGSEEDVRMLENIRKSYGVEVVLYFEKDLAENSTYEKDLLDFANSDMFERPFITSDEFIKFGKENDPSFEGRLTEFPLMIQILDFGERRTESGGTINYIKGMMPFLDEFDVNKEPGPYVS